MEIGFIQKTGVFPNFEQVSRPNTQKVQKLAEADPTFLLKEGSETREINKDTSKTKK